MMQHHFENLSDGEVYNETQTNEEIHDGDILLLSGNRTAILCKAWPVMVRGTSLDLHRLADDTDWCHFEAGKYLGASKEAYYASCD